MKHLMIVESPNKCKKIQSILGSDWIVKASTGHVRDLPPKEMGVDFETFKPNYVPSKKGKAVLSGLRKLTQAVDRVWLATDPDREGEAIAWHLQQALSLINPHRVSFNVIMKSSVTGFEDQRSGVMEHDLYAGGTGSLGATRRVCETRGRSQIISAQP